MNPRAQDIRNGWLAIGVLLVFGLAGVGVAACFVVMALAAFLSHPEGLPRAALDAAGWLVGAYAAAAGGISLCKRARSLARCRATLDEGGFVLVLHPRRGSAAPHQMAWKDLQRVGWRKVRGPDSPGVVRLVARDGSSTQFTGLDFLRPRAVAQRIADAAGLPLASDSA